MPNLCTLKMPKNGDDLKIKNALKSVPKNAKEWK